MRLCSMAWDLVKCYSWKCLVVQEWKSNFFSSILLAQKWSLQVIRHFGKLETFSTTLMLTTLAKPSWRLVKIGQEVRTKIYLNLLNFSLSVLWKMSWLYELISSNISIFWTSTLRALQSFRIHKDLQLSCWKFSLNHLAS